MDKLTKNLKLKTKNLKESLLFSVYCFQNFGVNPIV
jgi:hypothetical protein